MKTLRFNTLKIINESRQKRIYKSMHKNASAPHESVGWISKERQSLRFEKLTVGIGGGDTVLDFGCGLGDLYGYVIERDINIDYFGIDLVDEFVSSAKKRYTEGIFVKSSIFDMSQEFDYVLSSGVYAFGKKEIFENAVEKCYELASKEYRFNILLNAKGGGYFNINQSQLERFVMKLCKNSYFEYGYLDNDITVYMPKI